MTPADKKQIEDAIDYVLRTSTILPPAAAKLKAALLLLQKEKQNAGV